jgi:hypothetical protein|tara:strand:+ start:1736 stop:2320 length:585 start_codon:yes stop_codon:yes gene_type:complete
MANIDAGFGLRPVGKLGSEAINMGTSQYQIANGETDVIFKGDLVKLETTGKITKSGNGDAVAAIGVFNGCFYNDPTTQKPTFSNHYPGSITPTQGAIDAFVYDDPNMLFEIQADGVVAADKVGRNADIVYAAGNTINGQSKTELNSTVANAGAAAQLRIIRICEDPENSDIASANANWIVRINEHQYYADKAGV